MTASNYIRSRLYPLSGRLTGSLSSIPVSTRPSPDIVYFGPPLYSFLPFFFNRPKLQSWLEQLTPAQKQRLDDALIVSIAAYLKTHPNDFMVNCMIDNAVYNQGGPNLAAMDLFTINADVNDTASIYLSPSNSNEAFLISSSSPFGTWSNGTFFYKCMKKELAASLSCGFYPSVSSVTYSHGGKQIVLTQKNPNFWSN